MARKTATSTETPTKKNKTSGNVHWVNVRLDDAAGAGIEEKFPNETVTAQWLMALIVSGRQVFIKVMDDGDSFMAGYIDEHPDLPGVLMGVSGFSGNAYDAVRSLLYKWYVELGEFWPEPGETPSTRFR